MKRILLFLLTNLGILLVLSVSLRLLGVEPYLSANGLNVTSLLVFAAVMGFGGFFLSLALSKWMAKRSMGVVVITTPSNSVEYWLVETVRRQAAQAGRQAMIRALWRLMAGRGGPLPGNMAAFGISGGGGQGWKRLFLTHPPLKERIAALQAGQK
jgi:Zn-dependent protease with chaperone function